MNRTATRYTKILLLVFGCALLALSLRIGASTASAGQPEIFVTQEAPQLLFLPVIENAERAQPTATPQPTATATVIQVTPVTAPPIATTVPVPPARTGLFALSDWLTYNAATAIDAQGGVHLAFYTSDERHDDDSRGQPAYYTYCPPPAAHCVDGAQWHALVIMDDQVNEIQIAVNNDGAPRLLVRRNGSNGYDYDYWACNNQCTNGESWSGLRVTSAAGVDLNGVSSPQHSFTLDAQGHPRFVYSNSWGNGRHNGIWYALCDAADCTEPGSWRDVPIYFGADDKTTTSDNLTLKLFNDKPQVVTRLNTSGLADHVVYLTCESNCEDRLSWFSTPLLHPEAKGWASWDLELDNNGHPRVALYEPAAIDINVTGMLYYGACDSECTTADHWQLTPIANGEGKNVDLAIDSQGRTHMVYDAGQRAVLAERWCDSDCLTATQWQQRRLETSTQLQAEFPTAIPLNCDDGEHAWFDAIPQVNFTSQGQLVVAYDAVDYAVCYFRDPTNPQNPPGREVKRIWWAVRWAYFERP